MEGWSLCDTAVRTGTSGTGAERTQFVHTPGLPVTHPPGFVPYSFTLRRPHIIVRLSETLLIP